MGVQQLNLQRQSQVYGDGEKTILESDCHDSDIAGSIGCSADVHKNDARHYAVSEAMQEKFTSSRRTYEASQRSNLLPNHPDDNEKKNHHAV